MASPAVETVKNPERIKESAILEQLLSRIEGLRREFEDLETYCADHLTHYYGVMTLHRLMLEDLANHIKKCPQTRYIA